MYGENSFKIKKDPIILGIESSCDDTCAAVIRGRTVLSNKIISSAELQAEFGGVVPEIASREHTSSIDKVVRQAIKEAGISFNEIDCVAATYGAGLLGALLVGLTFAKSLALALNVPFIAVNHIRGHMAAAYLEDISLKPPFITLLASGGHTAILHTVSYDKFEILGGTVDDAAGEAFDKCARVLGLGYPGGPKIQNAALSGKNNVAFPSALCKTGEGLRFSYSGLKTSVINYCHTLRQKGENIVTEDVAASFQRAAIDPLTSKAVECAKAKNVDTVTVGGGVAANAYLRDTLAKKCKEAGLKLVLPQIKNCTDNAAMIAAEGLVQYNLGNFSSLDINACAYIPFK